MTTPPKPEVIDATHAPAGVECKWVDFWQQRPLQTPRILLVHTNGASREGSIEAAWNWAHAAPNKNTIPHYQVDRTHDGVTRARKMLPSNRRGIANATVLAYQGSHGNIRDWSLAIETADLGWPDPGGACGFDAGQGELIAQIIAYESVLWGFPIEYPTEWFGTGVGSHTEPFGYPYTTTSVGKPCPGDAKKRDMREWVMPRAREIRDAWTAAEHPIVIDPPTSEEDDMASSVLCLEDDRAPHAYYRCDGVTKVWIRDQDAKQQIDLRLAESAGGTKPAVDGFVYRYMRHGDPGVIASYGPIVGPVPDGHDVYGRH